MIDRLPPSLPPLDILRYCAEQCLNTYKAHSKGLFPLSSILSYIIEDCDKMLSSISLWNQQFLGAIISTAHSFVRILNEIICYLEEVGAPSGVEPLPLPPIDNSCSFTNQSYELQQILQAPCFLYDNLLATSFTKPDASQGIYQRFRSLIPRSYRVNRKAMIAHKKQCLASILAKYRSVDSPLDSFPRRALVILSTVYASTLSARSVLFLSSPAPHDKDLAALLIPGPIPRKEMILSNAQTVKVVGHIPPFNVEKHVETLSFTEKSLFLGLFPQTKTVMRQVISPAQTGVLLPFIQGCEDYSNLSRIANNTCVQAPPIVKNAFRRYSRPQNVSSLKLKRASKDHFKLSASMEPVSFKTSSKQHGPLSNSRKYFSFPTWSKEERTRSCNYGYLYCCRMLPTEYSAGSSFHTRIPLVLTPPSLPHLGLKKEFHSYPTLSYPNGKGYLFTLHLYFPTHIKYSATIYISKLCLRFSGPNGHLCLGDLFSPLPFPCSHELFVDTLLSNESCRTEYGLYDLHTQEIEWQPSTTQRYRHDTKSCLSMSVPYCIYDTPDTPVHPTVDVSINSTMLPDTIYITEVVP